MTTKKQKAAVKFCEECLEIKFEGDLNDYIAVSQFLVLYLEQAKKQYNEIACEYQAYVDELD